MKPIQFNQVNTVFGADQPEYQPLPAHKSTEGDVTTCWELTDEEIEVIKNTKKIFISLKTFNQPIQPMYASTDINEVICLVGCESCEKETDVEIMSQDDDSNWFCHECWKELTPVMKAEYDELVKNGEIDAKE